MIQKLKTFFGSWIIISVWLYFISIAVYIFHDQNEPFWLHYFWINTLVFHIFSLFYNFKTPKTNSEYRHIAFLGFYRTFILLYYILGLIFADVKWLDANIYSIIFFAICSFLALNVTKTDNYEKN
jgi:hypothetical protein